MKKFLAIALLLLYGAASSGATLQLHYCCGKLDKIALEPPREAYCGKDHTMGSKPCCDTKAVSLKIKAEQQAAKAFHDHFGLVAINETPTTFFVASPVVAKRLLPEIFAPPPVTKDFNLLYCTYRI